LHAAVKQTNDNIPVFHFHVRVHVFMVPLSLVMVIAARAPGSSTM
jgi:hypothetical protein